MPTVESLFPNLFSPLTVGPLHFKNRAVMAPMTTEFADPDGKVTPRLRDYYRARAEGGVAAVIVEGANVHPSGKGWPNHLSAYDYEHLEGLTRLAADIKRAGAIAILQIMHCGRQTKASHSGMQPLAPSPIPCPRTREMPRELTLLEIQGLVEAFAQATELARDANFDAVELHAAHGYLINQFLSPYSNKRSDEYGGPLEDRTRFLCQIIARARELVGERFPLLCRISADEFVPGGIDLPQAKEIAQTLARLRIAAIHVSAGVYESYHRPSSPAGSGEAVFADLARGIRSAVSVPVIAVGRIPSPEKAQEILSLHKADLIAFGRALIADPELIAKAQYGRTSEAIPCIGCNVCNHRSRRREVHCLTNPLVGREATRLKKVRRKRKVFIAGAALAGLYAALVASERGHSVTVADIRPWPGGLFHLRHLIPNLEEFGKATDSLLTRLERLGLRPELSVPEPRLLGMAAEADLVLAALPGSPRTLPLEITPPPRVIQAQDLLSSLATGHWLALSLPNGSLTTALAPGPLAVVGGNLLGAETALLLAHSGHEVHLIEEGPALLENVHPAVAHYLLRWLEEKNIQLRSASQVVSASDGKVETLSNGQQHSLQTESLVVSLGYEDDSPLLSSLREAAKEFHLLGDAYDSSDTYETVLRALEVASTL